MSTWNEVKAAAVVAAAKAYFGELHRKSGGCVSTMAREAKLPRANVRIHLRRIGLDPVPHRGGAYRIDASAEGAKRIKTGGRRGRKPGAKRALKAQAERKEA